jgi:hypothetical protein
LHEKVTNNKNMNATGNFNHAVSSQTQSNLSNDNTFIFNMPQNKSLLGEAGGTLNSMGPMMSSFGHNSATSTWINSKQIDKKSTSPNSRRNK